MRLDILKKIGKAGLNLAGVQAGAGKDKVRALEAEKELLELKVTLARQSLEELLGVVVATRTGFGAEADQPQVSAMIAKLDEHISDARQALEILGASGG